MTANGETWADVQVDIKALVALCEQHVEWWTGCSQWTILFGVISATKRHSEQLEDDVSQVAQQATELEHRNREAEAWQAAVVRSVTGVPNPSEVKGILEGIAAQVDSLRALLPGVPKPFALDYDPLAGHVRGQGQ